MGRKPISNGRKRTAGRGPGRSQDFTEAWVLTAIFMLAAIGAAVLGGHL